ncbi:MAG TPA: hypothetical protein VH640_17460 [Bryobacteraceae bacterium]|jgi:hypothetical protein
MAEEMSDRSKLLCPSAGGYRANGAKFVQGFEVHLVNGLEIAARGKLLERFERSDAMPLSCLCRVLMGIVVCRDCSPNRTSMAFASAGFHHLGTARLYALPKSIGWIFELSDVPARPRPIARIHGLANALAVDFAITPDRARTFGVKPALASMWTGL